MSVLSDDLIAESPFAANQAKDDAAEPAGQSRRHHHADPVEADSGHSGKHRLKKPSAAGDAPAAARSMRVLSVLPDDLIAETLLAFGPPKESKDDAEVRSRHRRHRTAAADEEGLFESAPVHRHRRRVADSVALGEQQNGRSRSMFERPGEPVAPIDLDADADAEPEKRRKKRSKTGAGEAPAAAEESIMVPIPEEAPAPEATGGNKLRRLKTAPAAVPEPEPEPEPEEFARGTKLKRVRKTPLTAPAVSTPVESQETATEGPSNDAEKKEEPAVDEPEVPAQTEVQPSEPEVPAETEVQSAEPEVPAKDSEKKEEGPVAGPEAPAKPSEKKTVQFAAPVAEGKAPVQADRKPALAPAKVSVMQDDPYHSSDDELPDGGEDQADDSLAALRGMDPSAMTLREKILFYMKAKK
jgi:hypothetical protein